MKEIFNKWVFVTLLLMVASTSCKKSFLETVPAGKLVAQTTSDYNLLLSNTGLINTFNTNAQVYMGDEVAAVDPYFTASDFKTQNAFKWQPILYQPTDDAGETLVPLQNIYLYNKVINEVPNSTNGTDVQKLSIAAEAMSGRAWTYFLMINYYGNPYKATTASTDPGFPIVTTADVTATTFTRASVQEVYDFIKTDLLTALPNLPTQITNRTRMSKAAAEGILGKVYMFMGRFNDALPFLNAAITDMANQSTPVRLYDYNIEFNTGGSFLPIGTSGPVYPTTVNNVENIFSKQLNNFNTFSFNEIVASPQTAALFGSSDLRLKFYTRTLAFSSTTYSVPNVLRRWGASTTQFGLTVPDLYLLRAECKCRTNDLAGAKADVEALRIKRMPATDAPVPAATATQQVSLLNFILNERIREFAVLGYRWFDMRRLSVDPLYSSNTYTHTLYSATGSTTIFQLKPERFTLQFSPKLIAQNPGFTNNP